MEKLLRLLKESYPAIDFENEKHLITDKILDSVEMVSIISTIEDEYGVEITMEYITPKNFESVEAMWNMIEELS